MAANVLRWGTGGSTLRPAASLVMRKTHCASIAGRNGNIYGAGLEGSRAIRQHDTRPLAFQFNPRRQRGSRRGVS